MVAFCFTWGTNGLISQRILGTGARSSWYHYGPQAETRYLTNSAGTVLNTYTYTAYGETLASTGTEPNSFRYGGQVGYYFDTDMGIYLAGARWYHPYLMRWMTRDPIKHTGGENLYAYVRGNPVKFIDPSGLVDINLMRKRKDRALGAFIDNPNNRRVVSILGHGSPTSMDDENGNRISPKDLADRVRKHRDFENASHISLFSCSTGKGENSFAQRLADATGKWVLAPVNDIVPYEDGRYFIACEYDDEGRCITWKWFRPRR